MSILVGLTGPTGAGKSMAADIAKRKGIKVIDCDKLAREAVEPESDGLAALVNAFGSEILLPNGALNRKKMAQIAFSSREDTEKLNRVLLPHISKLVKLQIDCEYVLIDAPTLFESGLDSICDTTIVVLCDATKRKARIITRDNLTAAEAELRMSAGKPDAYYIERAGHIIYNNDGQSIFEFEFSRLLKQIYGGNKNG